MIFFKNDEFKELQKSINKMFSEAEKNIDTDTDSEMLHDSTGILDSFDVIWPAVMRCETFFRNSNDIRALEFQVHLLMMMQNNIYIEVYWSDAYTICKRISEIDPNHNKKNVKKTIENIISLWDCRASNDPEKWAEIEKKQAAGEKWEFPRRDRSETEKMLEERFEKIKENNYDYFLDDWEASHKIVDHGDLKDGYTYSSKGRKY